MATVNVSTTFRPGTKVFAYKIPAGWPPPNTSPEFKLGEPVGSAVADSAGTVAINTGVHTGATWVTGEPLNAMPPVTTHFRTEGVENPYTVRATAA